MVIVQLSGGLGNQLFQYAAATDLAAKTGEGVWMNLRPFQVPWNRSLLLDRLNVDARRLPMVWANALALEHGQSLGKRLVRSVASRMVKTIVDAEQGFEPIDRKGWRSVQLVGHWQAEGYFTGVREMLRRVFTPRAVSAAAAELGREVSGSEAVAVHVRRGDLVTNPVYASSVGTLGVEYYAEALELIRAAQPTAVGYVFSDDPDWCDRHLPPVIPLVHASHRLMGDPVMDMYVMRQCRHFVLANSTFSWWPAWLQEAPGRTICAPSRFFVAPRPWEHDLIPDRWMRLDPRFSAT